MINDIDIMLDVRNVMLLCVCAEKSKITRSRYHFCIFVQKIGTRDRSYASGSVCRLNEIVFKKPILASQPIYLDGMIILNSFCNLVLP